jgi:NADH:ubiquinone oxidoreductase subunit 2 (subunit N)
LALVGVVNVLLAALCYLRVIRVAFLDDPVYEVVPRGFDRSLQLAMGLSATGVVFLGAFLGPLLNAANNGHTGLSH